MDSHTWEPNRQSNRLKALLRGISLSEYGLEGLLVRLRRLSEYGCVAYLVERPTRETQAEQYSNTALFLCQELRLRHFCLTTLESSFSLAARRRRRKACKRGSWRSSCEAVTISQSSRRPLPILEAKSLVQGSLLNRGVSKPWLEIPDAIEVNKGRTL